MKAYKATIYIKTDYALEGVKEVLEKLMSIPEMQYMDCEGWTTKIGLETINVKNIVWRGGER